MQVFTSPSPPLRLLDVTTVTQSSTDVSFSIMSRVVVQSGSTLTRSCITPRVYGQRTTCDPQTNVRDVTFNPETQATCGRTELAVSTFIPCK